MFIEEIHPKIESLAKKVFDTAGMDLIDLKVAGHKNDVIIQITADKSSGGITIRECAILNKAVIAAIEQEKLLPPEIFSLELSSPGLDRPLVTRRDFMRVIGQELDFCLQVPLEGKKELTGVLIEAGENDLIVERMGKKIKLPLSSIIKGTLVI